MRTVLRECLHGYVQSLCICLSLLVQCECYPVCLSNNKRKRRQQRGVLMLAFSQGHFLKHLAVRREINHRAATGPAERVILPVPDLAAPK